MSHRDRCAAINHYENMNNFIAGGRRLPLTALPAQFRQYKSHVLLVNPLNILPAPFWWACRHYIGMQQIHGKPSQRFFRQLKLFLSQCQSWRNDPSKHRFPPLLTQRGTFLRSPNLRYIYIINIPHFQVQIPHFELQMYLIWVI